jgi:hypothetical protein
MNSSSLVRQSRSDGKLRLIRTAASLFGTGLGVAVAAHAASTAFSWEVPTLLGSRVAWGLAHSADVAWSVEGGR